MLYFRYRRYIKVFKRIKNANNVNGIDIFPEDRFGKDVSDAISILKTNGGLYNYGLHSNLAKDGAKIDATILEYEEKCSRILWGIVKWAIGTAIAIAGLFFAYLSIKNSK